MSNFWKSARRWLPGVIISLAAIAVLLYFVDLRRFMEAIRSANYRLLLAVFATSLIWLVVRGMVWLTLLRSKATYRDSFLTVNEGYLLNNFLPFRLGEIGRAFLMGRKSGLGFMEVLPSIIIERIIDLTYAAGILLGSVPFVVGAAGASKIAIVIAGVMVIALITLYVLARNQGWALGVFRRLSGRWSGLQTRGGDFLASLFSGLSILTDGWLFIRVILWMTLDWAISVFSFYLLLRAFFPQATLVWSLFGLGFMSIGNAIPSLPGAIGTFEAAFVGAIAILSGNQSAGLAAALVSHFSNYISTGVIGLYALSTEGETLMGIYRQLRRKGSSETVAEHTDKGDAPVPTPSVDPDPSPFPPATKPKE